MVENIVRVAETAKTYGPPIALSNVNVKAGGQPRYPSCMPCSVVWRHRTARRKCLEDRAERIMATLTVEASAIV